MSLTHHTIKLNKSKMEGKSMLNLSQVLAFLLLASLFQTLMARDLISDGIELVKFPVEKDGEFVFCPGKQSWPELVGKSARYAKEVIQKENPIVTQFTLLFPGMPKPAAYICGRVYLVVNWKLIVQVTPSMG
ncbi:proteinase inhibitor I-B-like isoform X2 [Solanum pennellii]|uniref:Proteinase inhibitor I-B-like isoform X2 n=1 Tax=Solanum pennellii TaxID=28526 RepID=A0ABM1HM49_SOLPN|nr:proteinase inhibitor I-B-like isoform X2 [Solanum pennellii]